MAEKIEQRKKVAVCMWFWHLARLALNSLRSVIKSQLIFSLSMQFPPHSCPQIFSMMSNLCVDLNAVADANIFYSRRFYRQQLCRSICHLEQSVRIDKCYDIFDENAFMASTVICLICCADDKWHVNLHIEALKLLKSLKRHAKRQKRSLFNCTLFFSIEKFRKE